MERNLPTVSVAEINTSNYRFMATGSTPYLAQAAVLAAWRTHATEENVDPDLVTEDDVNVMTGPIGSTYRDREPYPRMDGAARPRELWPAMARQWCDYTAVRTPRLGLINLIPNEVQSVVPLPPAVIERIQRGLDKHRESLERLAASGWRPIAPEEVVSAQGFGTDLWIGRGEHETCTPGDHDREPGEAAQATGEDGLMVCNDCGRALFYCANTGRYHHVDPNAKPCWLTTNC